MLDSLLGLFKDECDPRVVGGAVRRVVLAKLGHSPIPDKDIKDLFGTTEKTIEASRRSVPSFAKSNMHTPLTTAIENILDRDGRQRSDALSERLILNIHQWVWAHCSYNKVS